MRPPSRLLVAGLLTIALVGLGVTLTPSADAAGRRLTVLTCNAQRDLPPAQARRVIAQCAGTGAAVIMWQEIESRPHRRAIRELAGYQTIWPGRPGTASRAVPISYRSDTFSAASSIRVTMTHHGIRGVSPNRYVITAVLHAWDGWILPVLNTHMISGAWTRHPERRPLWRRHATLLRSRSADLVARYGRMIGAGDFNRSRWVPTGRGLWAPGPTFGRRYPDAGYAIGAGLVAGADVSRRISTLSDHAALLMLIHHESR